MAERLVIGWDVGGAHVKACVQRHGEVVAVAQWACPLWQGLDHLQRVLAAAQARWPELGRAQHAVTMTGEMVDLFADREDGVRRIADALLRGLGVAPDALHFFAGDAGWCEAGGVARRWAEIASANWLATARHAALCLGEGWLVDIGSTTTDLIRFEAARVPTASRSDVDRLASGELVYQGVVRTPLCALAQRIEWRGRAHNVMNEFFATTADVYRLTGELAPGHDQHPTADNAAKDALATRRRLARMIGLDERDGTTAQWLAFAQCWREAQVDEIAGQLRRVMAASPSAARGVAVSAGCGDFLVADVLARAAPGLPLAHYGRDCARAADGETQAWAQVCAPSVAVAALFERERR